MASAINETEGTLGLVLTLGVLALIVWLLFEISGWFKTGGDAGKAQSLKNAVQGFPDGADPGTIPAFQYTQGVIESFRNFHDYVFGSDEDNEADSGDETVWLAPEGSDVSTPDLPPATPAQIAGVQSAVARYSQATGATVQNWVLDNLF